MEATIMTETGHRPQLQAVKVPTEVQLDEGRVPEPAYADLTRAGAPRDTSYEVELDDDREDPEPVLPVPIPLPPVGGERRPVIPPHLRTWGGVAKTAARYADAGRHHTAFHLSRSPWYLLQA